MVIIRRLNCTDTASGIVSLKILVILDHSLVFRVTMPDAVSIQFNLLTMRT